ncbi:aldehyde dehydrogenase family protein [Bosea sp. (in: a-proteobacteria)]|uniref:aldehyde dehydrogenase family protein n=1 Tax=Bosea sp. (in: a-proteobacteria) TaxID=1871050 RepID=UPI003B3A6D53
MIQHRAPSDDAICLSPVDGRELARRRYADDGAIAAALMQARHTQRGWALTPLAERVAAAMAFVDALLAMNDEIVPELAWQIGRPIRYGGEARGLEERGRRMAALAQDALAPVVPSERPGTRRRIERRPVGLVLVVAPWNYPYLTAINTIVPALIAGNAVILKAASQALLTGDRFQMAAVAAKLPPGLFQSLILSHDATLAMIATGAVDHVNFTGSVPAGRSIARAAGEGMVGLGLELGGKDAAYVRSDAAIDVAVPALVDGAFFNSGQCCCGVERIYVHHSLYDRFVEAYVAEVGAYRLGNPLEPETTLGPMAHARFADLVREQTAQALSAGARACVETSRFPEGRTHGPYLAPQVLVDVDHGMDVMRDESFGPIVGIMKVADDSEAIFLMNDSRFGLTASIWSADLQQADRLGDAVEAGTVFVNRCDYLDPDLAWTGLKESGRGISLSSLGYAALTRPRSRYGQPALSAS